ncbi:MAG TPA: hypothetical protein VK843_17240 [Planctomycetota bacterium]|nr:hypothetical protein [Planctomycetota bacterium]
MTITAEGAALGLVSGNEAASLGVIATGVSELGFTLDVSISPGTGSVEVCAGKRSASGFAIDSAAGLRQIQKASASPTRIAPMPIALRIVRSAYPKTG